MQTKAKQCSRCSKLKPIFKNKTIEGEKKQFCQSCWGIVNKEQAKEKRKKVREKKKATWSYVKLQPYCNKLIKEIYPLFCHSCYKGLELGTKDCQACHFVPSKNYKGLTFDPRNILPGCGFCNGFDESHTYELGKNINKYWGEGTAEYLREIKVETYSWSQSQFRELYELFTNPPQADTLEQTRQLILEQYLKIKG